MAFWGLLLLLGVNGCGGGGSPAQVPRIQALSVPSAITAVRSGEIVVGLTPSLANGERLECRLDEGTVAACSDGLSVGRQTYSELALGRHQLDVSVRSADGMEVRASWRFTWQVTSPDVLVYAASPGGIAAAVAAAREGLKVLLLEPSPWIGGMMSGGLSKTDLPDSNAWVLGGIASEVFARISAEAAAAGTCGDAACAGLRDFEPRFARRAFEALVASQPGIELLRATPLRRVVAANGLIQAVGTDRGHFEARVFVDGSYEGDLLAGAGVSYRIGREPRAAAGDADPADIEDHAGVQPFRRPYGNSLVIDPYVEAGNPASGLLPDIDASPVPWPSSGAGDRRVMAYTYRLCVTDDPFNQVPFTAPPGYAVSRYEAHARAAEARASTAGTDLSDTFFNPTPVRPSGTPGTFKYDLNGGSPFSTDLTGDAYNQAYTTADEAGREAIRHSYQRYIQGLLWTWQTDPRFRALNRKVARFGLCKDEFTDNDHWPTQLYVRESRRLQGRYVMNQNDVMSNGRRASVSDVIGFGSYQIDSHSVTTTWGTVATPTGGLAPQVLIEGFLIVNALPDGSTPAYPIPYRSLTPMAAEARNLLVPVALSATHVAFSSLRMEPTFMITGHAAGLAAAMSVQQATSVQALNVPALRRRLRQAGQAVDPR